MIIDAHNPFYVKRAS